MHRRHFLLGLTMGVGAGGVALSTTSETTETVPGDTDGDALTWETAQDWDGLVSESGVTHESVSGTDNTDAESVKMGYSYTDLTSPPWEAWWPMQDDLGGDVTEVVNGYTATNHGADPNVDALLSSTAWDFGGYGDHMTVPTIANVTDSFSLSAWSYHRSPNDGDRDSIFELQDGKRALFGGFGDGRVCAEIVDPNVNIYRVFAPVSENTWTHWVATWNGSTLELYKNGSSQATTSVSSMGSYNTPDAIGGGRRPDGEVIREFDGLIWQAAVANRALTPTEIQTIYDVVTSPGTLTTATKSFDSAVQPNLEELDYALNGQSITLDVTGSPGTVDSETHSQTLDGGDAYMIPWSDSHIEFEVTINQNTSDVTVTPSINSVSLVA